VTAACAGGAADSSSPATPASSVTAIRLDPAQFSMRGIGVVRAVSATAVDARGAAVTSIALTWTSDQPAVVSVTPGGDGARVVALAPGSATVRVSAGAVSATLPVTVVADVTELRVTPAAVSLTLGEDSTGTLSAVVVADSGVTTTTTWSSSDPQVAIVTGAGTTAAVRAVAPGTATVTATTRTAFGSVKSAAATVTVSVPARAVRILDRNPDIGVGRNGPLRVRISGDAEFARTVNWSSRAPGVADVAADGRITGVALGRATVVATSTADPRITDSVLVEVTALPIGFADFIDVPPGTFIMGNDARAESPAHRVTITKPFALQRTEMTQAAWRAVMGNNPSARPCDECPVETVSYTTVQAFLERLNNQVTGVRYRLPTEAEWEYAARAGTTGDFPGDPAQIAWLRANAGGTHQPVGSRAPNPWGFYDMIGNVGEWMDDAPRTYTSAPVTDPTGGYVGLLRAARGSDFRQPTENSRVSSRGSGFTDSPSPAGGFRLVRVLRAP
jgi:uncharacterized protein YjdB